MKTFSILSVAAFLAAVAAQELTECAETCIRQAIAAGREGGCRNARDLECLCASKQAGDTLRDCGYSQCEEEDIESILAYVVGLCEEAGVPITHETGRPEPTPAPTATGEPEAPAEPTDAPEEIPEEEVPEEEAPEEEAPEEEEEAPEEDVPEEEEVPEEEVPEEEEAPEEEEEPEEEEDP
ncbi:hypothetical protein SAPIO_CDS1765 [Scedosporium apiospermum]|uniref:CFEM domain-containing protein n=1 Tax=Pseudallescheria apiosperma TaxID=563466 RepID=A0A084GDP0_PSEDA|nr:uncharacterized protein SAPIO_CDS1765 [Scedosporium apiospermum]KEZ45452.1 hypothetical protein SAPIO_CDS1765 [Scedosporium apiospermum]